MSTEPTSGASSRARSSRARVAASIDVRPDRHTTTTASASGTSTLASSVAKRGAVSMTTTSASLDAEPIRSSPRASNSPGCSTGSPLGTIRTRGTAVSRMMLCSDRSAGGLASSSVSPAPRPRRSSCAARDVGDRNRAAARGDRSPQTPRPGSRRSWSCPRPCPATQRRQRACRRRAAQRGLHAGRPRRRRVGSGGRPRADETTRAVRTPR